MHFELLINIFILFTTLSTAVKLPTLCLNECIINDLGISKKSINNQNTINIICQNKKYKSSVLICLENKCETPGLKKYNIDEFSKMCSSSYTNRNTKEGLILSEKDLKRSEQRQFVLGKRLSFSGGEKNMRNREKTSTP